MTRAERQKSTAKRTNKPVPPSDLWEQIDAINKDEGLSLNDEGFTVAEYAKRYGMSIPGAHHRLESLLAKGKLIGGYRKIDSRRHRVYRIP